MSRFVRCCVGCVFCVFYPVSPFDTPVTWFLASSPNLWQSGGWVKWEASSVLAPASASNHYRAQTSKRRGVSGAVSVLASRQGNYLNGLIIKHPYRVVCVRGTKIRLSWIPGQVQQQSWFTDKSWTIWVQPKCKSDVQETLKAQDIGSPPKYAKLVEE